MGQVNSIFIYLENTHGSGKFNIYVSGVLDMGQVNSIFMYLEYWTWVRKFHIYVSGGQTWVR